MKIQPPMPMKQFFEESAVSAPELAKQLGVGRTIVHKWKQVPADRCMAVGRITGIPVERLRPDVFTEQPVVRKLVGVALKNSLKTKRKMARIAKKRDLDERAAG